MDLAYQLLLSELSKAQANDLLLADESFPLSQSQALKDKAMQCLSNRYDIAEAINRSSTQATFNDFDFSTIKETPQQIFYRVSKEKAVTHHLINQAYAALPANGKLFLAGYKNDGIKTYIDKAKKLFGNNAELINGDKTAKLAIITKSAINTDKDNDAALLDDKDYQQSQVIGEFNNLPVISKPGVFGWNKIDPGSQFLIDQLPQCLELCSSPPKTVLDLGCGYGFITLNAFHDCAQLQSSNFVLTDNNAAAIACAQQNVVTHGVNATVIADDCGEHISDRFDLILCNPPFHKGFDVSNDISSHFINHIHRLLDKQGIAYLVVNQFVGIEKRATKLFGSVKELTRNKSFKLIILAKPR